MVIDNDEITGTEGVSDETAEQLDNSGSDGGSEQTDDGNAADASGDDTGFEGIDVTEDMSKLKELGYDSLGDALKALNNYKKSADEGTRKITEMGQGRSQAERDLAEARQKLDSLQAAIEKPADDDDEFGMLVEKPGEFVKKHTADLAKQVADLSAQLGEMTAKQEYTAYESKVNEVAETSFIKKYSEAMTPEITARMDKLLETDLYQRKLAVINYKNCKNIPEAQATEYIEQVYEEALHRAAFETRHTDIEKAKSDTENKVKDRYFTRNKLSSMTSGAKRAPIGNAQGDENQKTLDGLQKAFSEIR